MDKSLHSLICGAVSLFKSILSGELLNALCGIRVDVSAQLFKFSLFVAVVVGKHGIYAELVENFLGNFVAYLLTVIYLGDHFKAAGYVIDVFFAVRLFNAVSHCVFKVRYALSAVLVVLIGLDSDTRQRGVAAYLVWFAEKAVTCGKAVLKKLDKVYLAAGGGKSKVVKVMDMDIAIVMSLGMLWVKHVHFVELLSTL